MEPYWDRIAWSVFCVILLQGCAKSEVSQTEPTKTEAVVEVLHTPQSDFDIDELVGDDITVEGVLEGDYIFAQSGHTYGDKFKGSRSLRIRYRSFPLSLAANSETLSQEIAASAGKRVRLNGVIRSWDTYDDKVIGGQAGQTGYMGPLPSHTFYFLSITSCENIPLDPP